MYSQLYYSDITHGPIMRPAPSTRGANNILPARPRSLSYQLVDGSLRVPAKMGFRNPWKLIIHGCT